MRRPFLILLLAASLLGLLPAATSASQSLSISAAKAPVTPDGTTAGGVTDFVLTFVDRDPAADGIGIKAGGTMTATLAPEFTDVGGEGVNTVAVLQGWPQSPLGPPPLVFSTVIVGNTITTTMLTDYLVGTAGPGPKQMHLLLSTFRNPAVPGRYPVQLEIRPDPGTDEVIRGTGRVTIAPATGPSIEVVSVFSGGGPPPPFNNPIYQTLAPGETSLDIGMYLWEAGSSAADGVFNAMVGAELVMLTTNSGRLVQNGVSVGEIRIQAPAGATDHVFSATGPSTLGVAAVSGFDTGILVTSFTTDPTATGTYVITVSVNGGNSQTLFITAE